MGVRHFDYAAAKNTMAKIQSEASTVKTILSNCNSIVEENVGVENRWSGQRASDFKQKWNTAAENFDTFVELINTYANKIDDSYRVHQQYDETQN